MNDTRYTTSHTDRGVSLVAWYGDIPMGGWRGTDEEAFRSVVTQEVKEVLGLRYSEPVDLLWTTGVLEINPVHIPCDSCDETGDIVVGFEGGGALDLRPRSDHPYLFPLPRQWLPDGSALVTLTP